MPQCLLEGRRRVSVTNVLIEVEFREGGDDYNLGRELGEELRHAADQLGKLKTGERPRHHDLPVELGKGHAAVLSQAGHQSRVGAVGAIEKQDALALQRQTRHKIMAQARRMALPVKDRHAARRQSPRLVQGRHGRPLPRHQHGSLRRTK